MERNPHLLIEGCADRLLRDRREGRLHLHPRRVLPRAAGAAKREIDEAYAAGLRRQEHPRHAASTATSTCIAAPAPTKPARRPRSSSRSKASARSRASSRRSRRSSALYGCPTAVNNVETLCNVPLDHDATAPSGSRRSAPRRTAGRSCSASAATSSSPGVYEAPMNVDAARADLRLRRRHARRPHAEGGHSRRLVGADPAAATSSTSRPASTACRRPARCSARRPSSCMDETTCMVWLAENLLHFYRHESCGKCTPCREGTDWLYKLLHRIEQRRGHDAGHRPAARASANNIDGKTLCAFGDAAATPVLTTLKHVPARVRGARREGRRARCRPTGARHARRWGRTDDGLTPARRISTVADDHRRHLVVIVASSSWRCRSRRPCMVYVERKVCGVHAAALRPVPASGPQGLLQPFADILKLMFKEELRPKAADALPVHAGAGHLGGRGVRRVRAVPFGAATTFFGLLDEPMPLQVADVNVGGAGGLRRSPRWASTASCWPAGLATASTRCSAACAARRR